MYRSLFSDPLVVSPHGNIGEQGPMATVKADSHRGTVGHPTNLDVQRLSF